MALGTNYKRNEDRETKAIDGRIRLAKQYAQEFQTDLGLGPAVALGLGTEVVLGRKTIKGIYEEFGQKCPMGPRKAVVK